MLVGNSQRENFSLLWFQEIGLNISTGDSFMLSSTHTHTHSTSLRWICVALMGPERIGFTDSLR